MDAQLLKQIEHVLQTKILKVEDFNKGLTNKNIRITTKDDRYILRIPPIDTQHVVHREHEAKAMELVKDLDVDTCYFNPVTGIKLTRYIPTLLTFTEYTGKDKLQRVAKLMRQLHEKNALICFAFNTIERYQHYAAQVKQPLVDPDTAQMIIYNIQALEYTPTLCHNDWVAGNICFTQDRDYLIDYEYAGDNDPFFDVMSFITENELSEDEKLDFMLSYFGRPWTKEESQKLRAYGDFHNLLWCTWAIMMYESRHDEIYLEIAQKKQQALQKRKPE